jgi:alkylhydroperoxidase/carboxymuconolactone decarboxylase family protein YurZ
MSFNPMAVIQKFDPELVEHYQAFGKELFKDGALSRKVKILAALALDALKGSATGVEFFTKEALDAGASWDEIREILRVAYHLGHGT